MSSKRITAIDRQSFIEPLMELKVGETVHYSVENFLAYLRNTPPVIIAGATYKRKSLANFLEGKKFSTKTISQDYYTTRIS